MALLADIKTALRITSDDFDSEVQMLVNAALADMTRVGVDPTLLEDPDDDGGYTPLVKQAITAYCKANFGYDNPEAVRLDDTYHRTVCDLLNSSANIAAK